MDGRNTMVCKGEILPQKLISMLERHFTELDISDDETVDQGYAANSDTKSSSDEG